MGAGVLHKDPDALQRAGYLGPAWVGSCRHRGGRGSSGSEVFLGTGWDPERQKWGWVGAVSCRWGAGPAVQSQPTFNQSHLPSALSVPGMSAEGAPSARSSQFSGTGLQP